ncbi:MAG: hypothetical protein V1826_02515, partial [bacterium]
MTIQISNLSQFWRDFPRVGKFLVVILVLSGVLFAARGVIFNELTKIFGSKAGTSTIASNLPSNSWASNASGAPISASDGARVYLLNRYGTADREPNNILAVIDETTGEVLNDIDV